MKSILELSDVKARKYFMESSNYCSLDLPGYIDFSKVLAYVEGKVGNKSLDGILKVAKKMPSEFEEQEGNKKEDEAFHRLFWLKVCILFGCIKAGASLVGKYVVAHDEGAGVFLFQHGQ